MNWWQNMVFPMRRVWLAAAARVKSRNNGGGLLKLHDDIQTCGYEDVQVMWEMLRRTESELMSHPPKRRPISLGGSSYGTTPLAHHQLSP